MQSHVITVLHYVRRISVTVIFVCCTLKFRRINIGYFYKTVYRMLYE